jgi:hypothetical protein
LAKGEVNIQKRERVPTLREFSKDFEKAIKIQCAEKPRTIDFYPSSPRRNGFLEILILAKRTKEELCEMALL